MTASQPMPDVALDGPMPRHYAWNARAITSDSALFSFGMSFVSATTVLPSLIVKLTDSTVMVGLMGAVVGGGWLLPQLLVASATAHMPRVQPVVATWAWIGRVLFLGTAAAIHFLGTQQPALTLLILFASMLVFHVIDGIVSVPWFDLLAKTIPPTRRGRVLGISQVLGGMGGIGAGVFVRYVLSAEGPWAFPSNYAVLYVMSSVALMGAAAALTCVREEPSATRGREVYGIKQVLPLLPRILRQDRAFGRLVVVRLMTGFISVANAFYVINATRNLGMSVASTGLFVSAQVFGSLSAGFVMTQLQDRLGPLVHLRTMIAISCIPPIIALATGLAAPALGTGVLYVYLVLYFFLGFYISSMGWPYFNYILEHAGDRQRPLYIGMFNTLVTITMLASTLGGWVVSAISYPAVFALALVFGATGLVLTVPLPNTRTRAQGQPSSTHQV